jgi:hypothetical protein
VDRRKPYPQALRSGRAELPGNLLELLYQAVMNLYSLIKLFFVGRPSNAPDNKSQSNDLKNFNRRSGFDCAQYLLPDTRLGLLP